MSTLTTVCIPCSSFQIVDSETLQEFDDMWNTYNGNLQNRVVMVRDKYGIGISFPKGKGRCGYNSEEWSECGVLFVAERRNFTISSTPGEQSYIFFIIEYYESGIDFYFLNPHSVRGDYLVSTKIPFNFYVIVIDPGP